LKPYAAAVGYPPPAPDVRTPPRPLPGFSCDFQPAGTPCTEAKARREIAAAPINPSVQVEERQASGQELGLPGRDLLFPKYAIHNAAAFTYADNSAGGGSKNPLPIYPL
jgi:alpha-glucosidase